MENTSIYQSLIKASAACGEIAGILDSRYLKRAHQRRQRVIEAAGSACLDGRPTTPERVFAWLGDVPLLAQANLGAEGYAAQLFAEMSGERLAFATPPESMTLDQEAFNRVGVDPLAAAAFLFRGPDAITTSSRAAYTLFLRRVFGPAEPAMSPLFGGIVSAAKAPPRDFEAFIADRLAKASKRALANARTLRGGLELAYSLLSNSRSSSHVVAIAEQLFAGHPLTISSASRLFKISRLAARKHLLRLMEVELAQAVARKKSGAVFVARDGIMTFGQPAAAPVSRAISTGSFIPLNMELRSKLDAAAEDVDHRLQELDRVLERLAAANRLADSK